MYDKNSEDTAIRFIVVNGFNVVFNIILVILRRSNSKYTHYCHGATRNIGVC